MENVICTKKRMWENCKSINGKKTLVPEHSRILEQQIKLCQKINWIVWKLGRKHDSVYFYCVKWADYGNGWFLAYPHSPKLHCSAACRTGPSSPGRLWLELHSFAASTVFVFAPRATSFTQVLQQSKQVYEKSKDLFDISLCNIIEQIQKINRNQSQ